MSELIQTICKKCAEAGASDIHLTSDWHPVYRVAGQLRVDDQTMLSKEDMLQITKSLLSKHQLQHFLQRQHLDFSYTNPLDNQRFRVNLYQERNKPAMALRHCSSVPRTIDELELPKVLKEIANANKGLILVAGITGSGKSTTLASMIDHINSTRTTHIVTIEDPIEVLYQHKMSLIHQRELETDTPDFASAVFASLREDPDVIMVGEMRDLATTRAVMTAAETGHLVMSTIHAKDAPSAIEKFVGLFPGEEQPIVRQRLADSMTAVIAQHLLPDAEGNGRYAALEIARQHQAIRNLICQDKAQHIKSVLEEKSEMGMQTLDMALARLVVQKKITEETAMAHAQEPEQFKHLLQNRRILG